VYTLAEVAEMVGKNVRTVRRWVEAKRFPQPIPLPGPWRFRRAEVDQLLSPGNEPK
jgi:excisionase family DNA binding protein